MAIVLLSSRFGYLSAAAAVPCVPHALAKCSCGATLVSQLDIQLHICHPVATAKNAMYGERYERSAVA